MAWGSRVVGLKVYIVFRLEHVEAARLQFPAVVGPDFGEGLGDKARDEEPLVETGRPPRRWSGAWVSISIWHWHQIS